MLNCNEESYLFLNRREVREDWAVYYTSPQSFKKRFSCSLASGLWGLLLDFDWLVYEVECPNVSTTDCDLQEG